jgi:chaperonin GroEL
VALVLRLKRNMTTSETPFDEAARRHIAAGVNEVVDAAKVALGPWGKRAPSSSVSDPSEDGVNGDTALQLEKHFKNVGAQMLKDVVAMTSEAVGDGTTTAMVLARWLYVAGSERAHAGEDPGNITRGIERAVDVVVAELERLSTPLRTRTETVHVGAASADGDEEIGHLIAQAIERVGKAGVVTLEGAPRLVPTLQFSKGIRFGSGYLSPYFVTNSERAEVVLDDAYVLITEGQISSARALSPLLDQVAKACRPLLIVAEVDPRALATLVAKKVNGTLVVCAVHPPWRGSQRLAMLGDIAVLVGGRTMSAATDTEIGELSLEDLGRTKTVIVTRDTTILLEGAGKESELSARVEHLRSQLDEKCSTEEWNNLGARLSKLTGDIAVIRVPAGDRPNELRHCVESAFRATCAAMEEGIVPGGGVALMRTLPKLAKLKVPAAEQSGVDIVARALEQPLRQLAENGGLVPAAVVNEVRARQGANGYNAISSKYEDLVAAGVVDATKVLRVALQSAATMATRMLTTAPLIAETAQYTPAA